MKRKFGFAAAWLGATIISLVIASAAVAGIRDRVEDSPVAAGIPTTLAAAADTTTTTDGNVVTTTEMPDTSSSSTSSTTTSSSTTTTSEVPVSSTNAPGVSTTSTTTSTTVTSTTTTTTTAPPTTTTTVASQTRVYELIGGTVTVRIGSGTVELVSLAPKTGFASKIKDDGPDKVKVTFTSNTHESKFEAEFEDGVYEFKIDEEPIGDDDD